MEHETQFFISCTLDRTEKLRRHELLVHTPEHPPLERIGGAKMRYRSCCGADRCRHGVTR
jgi:hypothetical protein